MIEKFQLKNGLKVILCQSHKSPVTSIQMWVRTGSADEKNGQEGISHFIEHLVFKGTRKFKVGEIASTIEGAGGELNAYTSFDQTVFYVTISKHFADTGLEAISEMMGFPLFDPTEIDNEREVVLEEIRRGQDSLSRQASELLFKTNYKKHPYGIPVIGYAKNIKKMSPKKITEYYQSRYNPANMFLVVAGDFEKPEMKSKVKAYFSDFQKFKLKQVKRTPEKKQSTAVLKVEGSKFEQSLAHLSWKIPNIKHSDIPALDVLALVLGQGDSSRLVKKLRIEEAVVNSIGASAFSPLDEGLFSISFSYNKEKLAEALEKIEVTLLDFFHHPPDSSEVRKAVLNLSSEEYYSVETVDGLSRKLGSLEFYFRDLKAQDKYIRVLQKLKVSDLLKVARKYLNEKTLCLCVTTNDDLKNTNLVTKKWFAKFKKSLKTLQKIKVDPKTVAQKIRHEKMRTNVSKKNSDETKKVVLKNGTTVLMRYSGDTKVISAKAAFLGGVRAEVPQLEGVSEVVGRTWTCGSKNKSEAEIYQEIESMAANLSPVSGRNSMGLGLDVLNGFEKGGCDLFLEVLAGPLFKEDVIQREKMIQLEQIKTKNDNPSQICGRLFMQNIFQQHPYSRDPLGSVESLGKIHHDEVRSYWDHISNCNNLTMMVTGNFDESFWLEQIEKKTQPLGQGEKLIQNYPTKKIDKDIQLFQNIQKEQSHVIFGFRGLSLKDPERYTLQVIQSILAGQGGRLFLELRDKNSLAYSVSPMRMDGIETGYFGSYIGCAPDKVEKSLSMMKIEFDKLMNEKVSGLELERSKKYLLGRHDIDLQRTSSVASAILYNDIYGIDYNEPFNCGEFYQQITAEQIQNLSQKLFTQKSVISVVGPQNPFL